MTQPAPRHTSREQGFTLVEMSIVIAIIGLLVGGITAGQFLIKQAEVQAVITDFSKYKGAYIQFKDQYKGPPGDITDATDYWGTDTTGTCPSGTATFKTATCNGDGDGTLDLASDTAETWRAWQQLANANLIDGTFTGVIGAGGTRDSVPGQNVPLGKRTASGYSLFWLPTIASNAYDQYSGDYGTVILYGATTTADVTKGAALTSKEAAQIDLKIDDGAPGTGKIFTNRNTSSSCVSDQTYSASSTAAYSLTNNGTNCDIGFKIDQ